MFELNKSVERTSWSVEHNRTVHATTKEEKVRFSRRHSERYFVISR